MTVTQNRAHGLLGVGLYTQTEAARYARISSTQSVTHWLFGSGASLGVTHVLISGKLHAQRPFEKMRAILVVWPDLLLAAQEHTGQRFLLQKGQKNPVLLSKS
jgi:hypothetical protein